jgi:hypothetical protein
VCGFDAKLSTPTVGGGTSVSASPGITSPVPIAATVSPPNGLYYLRIYVDGKAVFYSPWATVQPYIWMPNGPHTVELVAEDVAGYIATSTMQVNVASQLPAVSGIQNLPNWTSCSAQLTTGLTCAAGLGNAVSSLTQQQPSPALDGSSARFSLAGSQPYSNELYWSSFGGGNSASHFSYDLWFYIDDGDAPQSLEFDVNQAFEGKRWTFGTQCDFNQTHKWDIWDDAGNQWRPTDVPCEHFPSQTWVHLVWNFERVGDQVHYISLSVADQNYPIDTYYGDQPKWYEEGVDVAFQVDGNYKQQPYNIWLDEVQLKAY